MGSNSGREDVKLGFRIEKDWTPPNPVFITHVVEGSEEEPSWADKVGLEPEDEIMEVKGTMVENLTKVVFMAALKVRPLTLTIIPYIEEDESDDSRRITRPEQTCIASQQCRPAGSSSAVLRGEDFAGRCCSFGCPPSGNAS